MGAETVLRMRGLLRVAALAGAAAAFLLIAPGHARAADPLADAAQLVADAAAPVVEVTAPVVEATQPALDPVVEATKPITQPIVDDIVGRVGPIVDLPPTRPAPIAEEAPATVDEVAGRSAPLSDADRTAHALEAALVPASTNASHLSGDDDPTSPLVTASSGRRAVTPLIHDPPATSSPITNAGDGLLIGMLAGALIGIAAGRQSFSFERLRLPSSLALAPSVPPG